MTRLTQASGEARAQAAANTGTIWGNTIQTLGQSLPPMVLQAIQKGQIRRAIQDAGGDITKAIPAIMKIDPAQGSALTKQVLESQKTAAELRKADQEFQTAQWEYNRKRIDFAHNLIGSANTPEGYAHAILVNKQIGEDVSDWPQDFETAQSSGFLKEMNQSLLTAKERLEQNKPIHVAANASLIDPN